MSRKSFIVQPKFVAPCDFHGASKTLCEEHRGFCSNFNCKSLKHDIVSIKSTKDRGDGVFVNRTVRKGSIVAFCYLNGINDSSVWRYQEHTLCGITSKINHSCYPNLRDEVWQGTGTEEIVLFIANREIKGGKEVTYDYKPDEKSTLGMMKCLCKTVKCRGRIGAKVLRTHKKHRCNDMDCVKFSIGGKNGYCSKHTQK